MSAAGIAILQRHVVAPRYRAAFPVSLYLIFAAADLFFSLVAFSYGVAEGNPVMAWLLRQGLFVPGKVLLSLVVAAIMTVVYSASRRWHWAVWGGVAMTGAVVAYHLWAIPHVTGLHLFAIAGTVSVGTAS